MSGGSTAIPTQPGYVDANGIWHPSETSIAAALSSVSGVTTSTTVLAANVARIGATIFSTSSAVLFLRIGGGTASNTTYSVQLAASGYYELPTHFTGDVTGAWASATGGALVTEYT